MSEFYFGLPRAVGTRQRDGLVIARAVVAGIAAGVGTGGVAGVVFVVPGL